MGNENANGVRYFIVFDNPAYFDFIIYKEHLLIDNRTIIFLKNLDNFSESSLEAGALTIPVSLPSPIANLEVNFYKQFWF